MSGTDFDSRALRDALGRYATGVAVVAARAVDGQPVGLTINSFAAVSLEPPLVLWSLDNRSGHLNDFVAASHHAITVLAADQEDVSQRFATWPVDRFAGLKWRAGAGGAPVIDRGCSVFEVENERQIPGGDHTIFIGRVVQVSETSERDPLLFYGGRYRGLAPA